MVLGSRAVLYECCPGYMAMEGAQGCPAGEWLCRESSHSQTKRALAIDLPLKHRLAWHTDFRLGYVKSSPWGTFEQRD